MELVFATNNENKLNELKYLLEGSEIKLLSLKDINCSEEIAEPFKTLEENALAKAKHIKENYGYNCFADDTGLMVEALNDEPGVFSARYAGENASDEENIDKLLSNLEGGKNRNARFRTIIALLIDNTQYFFEGVVYGSISNKKTGAKGFGYDPVFIPINKKKSFAEMSIEEKNEISHRSMAVNKLIRFLKGR